MKATATEGIRVVAPDGTVYRDGENSDVPDAVATRWIELGRASEAKADAKPASSAAKAAPKTR
jgi:hypothetical protein